MSVCPSACLCFSLLVDSHKSETAYDQTSPNFRRMLTVAVLVILRRRLGALCISCFTLPQWLALPSGRETSEKRQCFIPGILWGKSPPPQENSQFPQAAAKLYALNIFFGRDSELQIRHENILSMDNKHRKLLDTKQSTRCKFMPKMHQHMFGGRALPRPAYALPIPISRNAGPTSKLTERKRGRGLLVKGEERGWEWAYL